MCLEHVLKYFNYIYTGAISTFKLNTKFSHFISQFNFYEKIKNIKIKLSC